MKKEEMERKRNIRTNRMLISMVVVFGICWLPLNTINFLADLNLFPIFCWEYHHFVFFVCHVMAMSSTCYNPFLYGCHNESFQREFVRMIPVLRSVCCRGGRPGGPGDATDDCLSRCEGLTTTNAFGGVGGGILKAAGSPKDNNGSLAAITASDQTDHKQGWQNNPS